MYERMRQQEEAEERERQEEFLRMQEDMRR